MILTTVICVKKERTFGKVQDQRDGQRAFLFRILIEQDVPEQPSACNVNDGSAFLEKCKFNDVQQLMDKMPSPEVVASVVATHTSTKTLREAFMAHKTFPVALVQPGQAHLDLLMRVQGILHMGHYAQQYERVVSGGVKPQVICDLLGISGGDDMLKCFEDAMTNSNALKCFAYTCSHRIEMGIDLYEVDMVSLHPMRWLTDAIIDVATRRMKEDLGTENVFILNTAFAQKLLVKGKLNRRPLNMSGCNYVGVEDTLTNIELKDGTIILVPISNMFFEKELEKAGRAANTVIVQHTEVNWL
uniref:Ubiquitin-like protease family profile domain-containing protein n=1 Tax=Magallana gigas TaxID=29159 RepID=K1QDA0_MAGGI